MLRRIAGFLFAWTFVVVALALAQEAAPPLPIGETEIQKLVIGLFAVVLPFLVNLLRKAKPTMPRMLVWSLPSILGLLLTWGTSLLTESVNPWSGIVSGLLAVAVHEARTTFKDHGING
jgi:hypothetical protein